MGEVRKHSGTPQRFRITGITQVRRRPPTTLRTHPYERCAIGDGSSWRWAWKGPNGAILVTPTALAGLDPTEPLRYKRMTTERERARGCFNAYLGDPVWHRVDGMRTGALSFGVTGIPSPLGAVALTPEELVQQTAIDHFRVRVPIQHHRTGAAAQFIGTTRVNSPFGDLLVYLADLTLGHSFRDGSFWRFGARPRTAMLLAMLAGQHIGMFSCIPRTPTGG